MTTLAEILDRFHKDIQQKLETARTAFGHPTTKGDASESVWLEMLNLYLPKRYEAHKASVVDSRGEFSQQIDVLIIDRQYTPFIFNFHGQLVVPAEGVYAAFEAKQSINAAYVEYAQKKIESVRVLHRTSLPIPHAGGLHDARAPNHIIGGFLSFGSDWKPPLGDALIRALNTKDPNRQLDLGCIAADGYFSCDNFGCYSITQQGKPATAFLLELIARLQAVATVPMIDVREYARWLSAD